MPNSAQLEARCLVFEFGLCPNPDDCEKCEMTLETVEPKAANYTSNLGLSHNPQGGPVTKEVLTPAELTEKFGPRK